MGGLGVCWPYRSSDGWGMRTLCGWKLSDRIRFVTGRRAEKCLLDACSGACWLRGSDYFDSYPGIMVRDHLTYREADTETESDH